MDSTGRCHHIKTNNGVAFGAFYWDYDKRGYTFKLNDVMNAYYDLKYDDDFNILDAISSDPTHLTSEEKMTYMNLQQQTEKK